MIASMHAAVESLCRLSGIAPVHPWVPDQEAELPCLVIGGIAGGPGDEPGLFALDLDLYVLGRRINDDDAQAELAKLTDQVLDLFGGTKSTRHDGVILQVESFERRTLQVAGLEVPVYVVTISSPAGPVCR